MSLYEEQCAPCRLGGAPMQPSEARELANNVPLWALSEKQIEREFKFKDFRKAIAFVNMVADAAEKQGHHPDIYISYGRVRLTLWTHKIGGLSRNDFILAAKIDRLAGEAIGA
jgi:4a-hydroxytetrahydrobiopterin dehydratase